MSVRTLTPARIIELSRSTIKGLRAVGRDLRHDTIRQFHLGKIDAANYAMAGEDAQSDGRRFGSPDYAEGWESAMDQLQPWRHNECRLTRQSCHGQTCPVPPWS